MQYRLTFVLAVAGLSALVSAAVAFAQNTGVCDVPSVFPTIQSAIDEPLCTTVRLAPLTYHEQLTIPRSLTLAGRSFQQGDESFVSRLQPPPTMTAPYALINVVGARTRVKIKHIVLEGPATAAGLIGVLSGRDTRLTIRDCVFRNMSPSPLNAGSGFVAIHVGAPLLPGAKPGITGHSITNCRFVGYQNAAIIVEGVGTKATITGNLIAGDVVDGVRPAGTAAPIGVLVHDGAQATIDRNDVQDNSREGGGGAAVVIDDGATGSIVSANNIFRNDLGVGVDGTPSVKIYRNALFRNDTGISLGETAISDSHTVQANRIESGGTGLSVGHSSSNSLSSNYSVKNTGDGIVLSPAAVKNKLYHNRSENNGGLGFSDSSAGKGTAGTANTYTSNLCSGNNGGGAQSSPLKLCK
ncbi:MAG: right-handed parallel beta-helix repeat-containing protein [Deltaproteobacteria bacterium]|nr:right-handed parallel beta-helix repeat-containing protein [Deltaproteobacteria bacterium]